ncbi:hypothetical protein [Vibrio maerlii]|uniref:hypothetical protein n=1 Tax=Vibrio maerlii TaxID=2231648 RepID=UPI000E3EDBB5|nr:hypothetical protein [Vibrio maerlii]
MKRLLIGISAIVVGFFSLIMTLVLALPLAIFTAIVGSKAVKAAKQQQAQADGNTYEGEFEYVAK